MSAPDASCAPLPQYTRSRQKSLRRASRAVRIGEVWLGGAHPLVVQSMTTTPTQDVAATVAQACALAEAGCQVVRVTAQNLKAAQALRAIRKNFSQAGYGAVPLVADIHFLPGAAMEAVEHVEKVRVNPGNYADKKRFAQRAYTDREYAEEIERLHAAFSPLVLRARALGRALRIGTNHGSLSDRIMNRYGDTPLGMCESALEFLRIAESHGFHDLVISMKASNPKVMIAAYRLMVAKMAAEGMDYPLHLGVTEAGDGDDARIKSAIGIGSLLYDGLGDTIRVSLTEDPVAEIPVARELAERAHRLWAQAEAEAHAAAEPGADEGIDVYDFSRREAVAVTLGGATLGGSEPPLVIQPLSVEALSQLPSLQEALGEARVEGVLMRVAGRDALEDALEARRAQAEHMEVALWEASGAAWTALAEHPSQLPEGDLLLVDLAGQADAPSALKRCAQQGRGVALAADAHSLHAHAELLAGAGEAIRLLTLAGTAQRVPGGHVLGAYRALVAAARTQGLPVPLWLRCTPEAAVTGAGYFGAALLEASVLAGSLLCDGYGDALSIETVDDPRQSVTLAYNVFQGARARTTKTEYVACPSCGRTLFDLQTTTQRVRAATGHLKGVTIAVMGCIVNGPGEMADADFGYVGGAPGKINLYVGKTCVKHHIPSDLAVEELVALIRAHGKWQEPQPVASA